MKFRFPVVIIDEDFRTENISGSGARALAEAIEKVARALDLVPFVLKNQGISFSDLAVKFGIAEKELYEELNIIFCCGLPGYTPLELIDLSFEDGFVSVINPQVLNVARKLSGTELLRLHLGLQFLIPFLSEELSHRPAIISREPALHKYNLLGFYLSDLDAMMI